MNEWRLREINPTSILPYVMAHTRSDTWQGHAREARVANSHIPFLAKRFASKLPAKLVRGSLRCGYRPALRGRLFITYPFILVVNREAFCARENTQGSYQQGGSL